MSKDRKPARRNPPCGGASKQTVADAKLQTQIADAWLNSPAYQKYLSDMQKLDVQRAATENIGGAVAAAVGAVLANFLPNILGKLGGILNIFVSLGFLILKILPCNEMKLKLANKLFSFIISYIILT